MHPCRSGCHTDESFSAYAEGHKSLSTAPDPIQNPARHVRAKYPAFLSVFPSIMLPMFLAVVDQTIVATALPAIAASTGQIERASWIVGVFLFAAQTAAPPSRALGEC